MDADDLQCQVCHRAPDDEVSFHCHRCARNIIYEPRLNLAQSLLVKETLGRDIEKAVIASKANSTAEGSIGNSKDASKSLSNDSARSEYRLIAARTQTILDDSRRLQGEIEGMRTQLAEMKANIVKRKRSVKTAIHEIEYEEETTVKSIQENIATTRISWDRLNRRIVNGRQILPKELISLYGFQIRRRRKDSRSRDSYVIAGVPVFNLKDLNNASPEHLNTSTYHIAHLIHLSAHYLGLRLPAEISLATAGQPHTYIHPPMSSYKAPTFNSRSRESSSNKSTPRKRLLWIDKPLPQLASEDGQAYSLYLDAIVLLAWNVAWVAKTQGLDVGGRGWEDICLVGKNLWDLFGESSTEPERSPQRSHSAATSNELQDADLEGRPNSSSQASAHSFLNSAGPGGAADYMKAWRYSTPSRIIETIKSALMNERMGADWEVLEMPEEEAASEENNGQSGAASSASRNVGSATSVARNEEQGVVPSTEASSRTEPREGWTKI